MQSERTAASEGSGAGSAGTPTESFEASAERLAAIVAELESGELPLERSLRLFEEGIKLARSAQKRLDEAEQRVEQLLGMDAEGEPITRDIEE
jgi:exodeoxyribonuclease VII small subunit